MTIKASDNYKLYKNEGGPNISTVARSITEKDGLYFKDIDGSGEVSKVNDWRLPASERAAAYVEKLTIDEKGVCISPNDVPGYDKDKYMPDFLKDENNKAYAYRDSAGNYYELNFGLIY